MGRGPEKGVEVEKEGEKERETRGQTVTLNKEG